MPPGTDIHAASGFEKKEKEKKKAYRNHGNTYSLHINKMINICDAHLYTELKYTWITKLKKNAAASCMDTNLEIPSERYVISFRKLPLNLR